MSPAHRVAWRKTVLVDRKGIAEPYENGDIPVARACTSKGRDMTFRFKKVKRAKGVVLLQLRVSILETSSPCCGDSQMMQGNITIDRPISPASSSSSISSELSTTGALYDRAKMEEISIGSGVGSARPSPYTRAGLSALADGSRYAIQYFPEVVCTHKGLVVIRLSSPHIKFPTDYFVYGRRAGSKRRTWVDLLPKITPEIHSGNSVGVLQADDGHYVVANLRFQVNPQTWKVHVFLDCYSSRNKAWSQREVTLPFPDEDKAELMCEWQTDLVIPFGDSQLMWVDLLRGVLLCRNLLDPNNSAEFEYIPLPLELRSARPAGGDERGRPQQFRNVACVKGELKLVNVHFTDQNSVGVSISTLQADRRSWTKKRSPFVHHHHPKAALPPSLFPVLSTLGSNILYLTVAGGEDKATLLRIDTNTWTLKGSTGYPRSFNHRYPPCPSQLSKYLHSWSGKNNPSQRTRPVQTPQFRSRAISSKSSERAVPKPSRIPGDVNPISQNISPATGPTSPTGPRTTEALSSQPSEHHRLYQSGHIAGTQSPRMGHGQFAQPEFFRLRPFDMFVLILLILIYRRLPKHLVTVNSLY